MTPAHAIICDDDAATRFVVSRILTQQFAYRVTGCASGAEALDVIASEHVTFMVLDVEMPEMSGIDVLVRLRAMPAAKTLPVIALSRARQKHVIERMVGLGVKDYLLKPLHRATFIERVQVLAQRFEGEPRRERR